MIRNRIAVGLCIAFAALQAEAASYFVQPIVSLGVGEFINGLEIDGATWREEGYFNAPTAVHSEVDLQNGLIRGEVSLGGGGVPASGSSQGRFGERLTFENADYTYVNLVFNFEGSVTSPARDPNLNSLLQLSVDAYMAVFDPSAGADANTWYSKSFGNQGDQSLYKQRITHDFTNPEEEIDDYLQDMLEAVLYITPEQRSFDIFVNLGLINAPNLNPGPVSLDFENTASFSIETDSGVTYTSLSGTFLDSTGVTVVPGPATLPLLGTGLVFVAGYAKRRKARVA